MKIGHIITPQTWLMQTLSTSETRRAALLTESSGARWTLSKGNTIPSNSIKLLGHVPLLKWRFAICVVAETLLLM